MLWLITFFETFRIINCVAYLHKLILLPYRYIPYVINIHGGTQFINMHHPSMPRPPMTTNAYVINIHDGTQFINMQFTLPRHAHRWQRMYAHRCGSRFQCWYRESSKSLCKLTFFPQKCLSKDLLHFGEKYVYWISWQREYYKLHSWSRW